MRGRIVERVLLDPFRLAGERVAVLLLAHANLAHANLQAGSLPRGSDNTLGADDSTGRSHPGMASARADRRSARGEARPRPADVRAGVLLQRALVELLRAVSAGALLVHGRSRHLLLRLRPELLHRRPEHRQFLRALHGEAAVEHESRHGADAQLLALLDALLAGGPIDPAF